jgi:hypothetical protein
MKHSGWMVRARVSLLVCIGALAVAASAHAQTTAIYFDSETGDYIGQGVERTITPAPGSTLTASRNYRNGVDVSFSSTSPTTWWTLNFGAAGNVPLAAGAYENATRFAFAPGNGLDVHGDGRGCNQVTGRFVVLEIAMNPDNSVQRFAADFEQHCEDGTPGLFGAVRYNSTISSLVPFSGDYPLYQLTITPDAHGRVTSSGVDCGGAGGASSCTLTLPSADLVAVTAVPDAGYEFTGWTGACSGGITAWIRVNQRKTCAARFEAGVQGTTALFFDSQLGDQVGQGVGQRTITTFDGTFQAQRNSRNGVSVSIGQPPNPSPSWALEFASNVPLAVGSYPAARYWSFAPRNGMYVRGSGGGCSTDLTGRFVVLEAVYRTDGSVKRFAADFEQHCNDGVPAIFGAIRFNSTIADLTPFGGQYPRYEIAMSVSGQGRVTGGGLDCTSAGPTCTVSLASPATGLTLTATPDPGHVFIGWTDDCRGASVTTLNVNGPKTCSAQFEPLASASPRTLLFIDSQPGAVGNGRQFLYSPSNSQWSVSSSASQVTFSVEDGLDRWRVSFSVPSGQTLAPGYYGDAHRQPFTPLNGLDVSGPSSGCNTLTGRFVIHEVAFGTNNTIVRFAADFEQHCNDANPATFGSIRYNANTDEVVPFGGVYPVYQMTLAAPAHGRITGGELDCGASGPVCQRTLAGPEVLSLTATPDFGYVFLGWTGDCRGNTTASINVNGPKSCAAVIEPVVSSSARSVFYADSRGNSQLGGGTRQLFTPLSSRFTVSASSDRSSLATEIDDGVRRWRVELGRPSGQALTVGYYGTARASSPFTRFYVSTNSSTCDGTGRFEILELAFGTGGQVLRFAADVEHHCQDAADGLFIAIRYNAETDEIAPFGGTYPVYQLLLATPVNGSIAGTGVNCSASASQCSVTLSAAAQVPLTATPVFGYTFVGWTDDCFGGPATTVHVNGPKRCSARFEPTAAVGPRTLLRWDSQANHYIGQGRTEVLSPVNSRWTTTAFQNASGVELRVESVTATSYSYWTLWFRAPTNEGLQVGRRYTGADDFPAAGVAGLFVFGNGRSCGGGEFTVREFVLANPTTVARFAADFVLDCGNPSGPLLTGSVQYNSMIDVPVTTLSVEPASLRFASIHNGASVLSQPAPQTVRLTLARQNVGWTAVPNQSWIQVSPSSGTGSTVLAIGANLLGGHPGNGSASGLVTVTLTDGTGTSRTINLTVTLHQAGTTAPAFGVVDTPLQNATGVTGALPMTGWALDDLDITGLTICRAAVTGEVPVADANCGGAAQVFLGTGTFVEGARPDVQTAFPTHPRADRGGWGFMLLTNMLPNQGNGTFVLYAYARDREGHAALLGTRTITCNNAQATTPFGAIDTPAQGDTVSGASYVNFGWALTPQPKMIPFDGSTIMVYVDGVPIGTPSYNHYRPDVATLFPGLANSGGPVGFKVLDTTPLTNGLHTIVWTVTDNAGISQGIGSRYFRVSNGTSSSVTSITSEASAVDVDAAAVAAARIDPSRISGRRSWESDAPWRTFAVGGSERIVVIGEEIDRFELALGEPEGQTYTGYLRVGDRLRPLPIGSRLDPATGVFTWSPGVGFVGAYDLVFVRSAGGAAIVRREVRIVLHPKGSGHIGAQVVIDTPRVQQDLAQPFALGGWAADLDASTGTGIDAIHVWAYPLTGGAPVFLGAAALGGVRPDVAAVHGERFRESGYGLTVHGLAPGHYDLAVFAWSDVSGGFVPAQVVRVTAR